MLIILIQANIHFNSAICIKMNACSTTSVSLIQQRDTSKVAVMAGGDRHITTTFIDLLQQIRSFYYTQLTIKLLSLSLVTDQLQR